MDVVLELIEPALEPREPGDELRLVDAGHAPRSLADIPQEVLRDVQVGHHRDHGDDDREVIGDGDAEDLEEVLFSQGLVRRPR